MSTSRTQPTIILTGTPGTGKTTHGELIAAQVPELRHINVGDLVKERGLHEGWDDEWQSWNVDEDKLLDELEPLASAGGVILDWHTCELFPERWADLVVVLRCQHTKLWERLESRNYPLKKIQENNEAEIMGVVSEEAKESYAPEIVVELTSESTDDIEANVARVVAWVEAWRKDHPAEDAE
ncbi:P-loop containing nucleoside triphosphate hydrolase protein [Peniophora sp. CONT]|nr:P-loop containing nucleoside triphosphate hydrolase protein [Peniophora sp. CONT]